MSDDSNVNVPWDQSGENGKAGADSAVDETPDLLQVSCPACGQALSLGREFLGGHCLCSTCDGLMSVSSQTTDQGQRAIVAEMVDKDSGAKLGDVAPTKAPDSGDVVIDKDTKPVKPWPKEFQKSQVPVSPAAASGEGNSAELGDTSNLLQVPCPDCGQVLALGREVLGSHCLCSVCDGLMLISLKSKNGGEMAVVAEKVDKITGEIVEDAPSTSAPEPDAEGAGMEDDWEDWENTRPVKLWAGMENEGPSEEDDMDMGMTMPVPKMDTDESEDDDMDLGMTMPIPKMDTDESEDDDMDLGRTMPIPGMADSDDMDVGATMPVPKMDIEEEDDAGLGRTMPVPGVAGGTEGDSAVPGSAEPQAPQAAQSGGGLPWEKTATEKQGVKLAPPGADARGNKGKAPPPTSGAVPTTTTPPTKAPPPTTGSVPTLTTSQVAARADDSGEEAPWKPPGAAAAPGAQQPQTQPQPANKKAGEPAGDKPASAEDKRLNPFGAKKDAEEDKKKAEKASSKKKVLRKRKKKGYKKLVFGTALFFFMLIAFSLFLFAPGMIPYGNQGREYVDGKIDEWKGQLEEQLAARAMNRREAVEAMTAGGAEAAGGEGAPQGGAPEGVEVAAATPTLSSQSDLELQKVLSQEGESVIRRFYGASSVEEKLAFVVDPEEARPDMERYYASNDSLSTVRSVMFRGGARDSETGYYYGVFDVTENESEVPRRWCVVDAGTGLYQVDWILFRQLVASELGEFLRTSNEEGSKKSFHMLLKLGGNVSADDSPWFEDAVSVEMQVPMISSSWFPVMMKKSVAEGQGLTTKLADGRKTIGVVEIAWVRGDKDPEKLLPAIVGIKRWGAWTRKETEF